MASLCFVARVAGGSSGRRCVVVAVAAIGLLAATPSHAETTIEPGVDRPGSDFSSFDLPQPNPEICRQACEENGACKAYTYVNPGVQGPVARCWLKSSVPPAIPNSCCTSGVKILPAARGGPSRTITRGDPPPARSTDTPSTANPTDDAGPLRRFPPGAQGQKPGPLGRGDAQGSLNGKPNPSGFPVCQIDGAGEAVSKVLTLLKQIFGAFGGTFDMNAWCGRFKREIATGVTLAPPQVPPGVPAKWGLLGGRGKLMAEATMCLLKDIGEKPDGPLVNRASSTVAGRDVEIEQTVGLIHFYPAARTAKLYQNVRIHAPLIGWLDAQRQTFDVTVRESLPAWPSGYKLHDYPIAGSYAVELDAEWSQTKLGVTLPPLPIVTPYGTVTAEPYLDYAARLLPVDTPFAYKGSAKHEFRYPQRAEKPMVLLQDHYGRSGVPFTLNAIANLPSNLSPGGWASQVGLGARDGGLNAKPWSPKQKPPVREDLNATSARSTLEVTPTVSFDAGVPIKYTPPNPTALFPALAGVADLEVEVVVNPSFKANFASQFGVLVREGMLTSACGSAEVASHCGFTEAALVSEVNSQGRIGIDGYVRVKVDLFVNPPFVDDFEVKRSFAAITLDEDRDWNPMQVGATDVAAAHSKFAWAGHAAVGAPDKPIWQGARGYSGMSVGDLSSWTQACFKTKKELPPPPEPTHDPGDAGDLTPDWLPCNLCVATDKPFALGKAYVVQKYKPGLKPSACKSQMNTGCYDLCSWNKKTGAWIQVEKTGAELFGQKCGGFTVK